MAQKRPVKPSPARRGMLAVLSVGGVLLLGGLIWWVVGVGGPAPRSTAPSTAASPPSAAAPTPTPVNRQNEEAAARLIWQAQHRMQNREFDAAGALIMEASALAPDAGIVHVALAGYYNAVRRFDEARDEARLALKTDPNDDMAQYQIGLSALGEGRYQVAVKEINKALVMNATEPLYFFHRALAMQMNGQPKEALESISAATLDGMNVAQLFDLRGRLRLDAGDYAGALADWERVLAARPTDEFAAGMKGVAMARLGRARAAAPWLQQGLKTGGDDASQLYELAGVYAKGGDVERASRTLAQAVEMQKFIEGRDQRIAEVAERPTEATPYYNLAVHYVDNQLGVFADGVFQRALALDPKHAPSLRAFGRLRLAMRDFDYGFRLLSQYLEERPGDMDLRREMAELYEQLQRFEEGVEVMRGFPETVRPDITYWQLLRRLKREAGLP